MSSEWFRSPRSRRSAMSVLLGGSAVALLSSCVAETSQAIVSGKAVPLTFSGGGWVTGFSRSGARLVARTDVGGLYISDAKGGRFSQVITASSVSGAHYPSDYSVESVAVSPHDSSVIVAVVGESVSSPNGSILVTRDAGQSWTRSAQAIFVGGNEDARWGGARVCFDRSNPNLVLIGTRQAGLIYSEDLGVTFKSASLPYDKSAYTFGRPGVTGVAMPPSGGGVYAHSSGVGLHFSGDGGGTWTLVAASSHGYARGVAASPAGNLVYAICSDSADEPSRLLRADPSGVVKDVTPKQGVQWSSVAFSPDGKLLAAVPAVLQSGQLVALCEDLDGATPSWRIVPGKLDLSDAPAWTRQADFSQLFVGDLIATERGIMLAEGMGTWTLHDDGGTVRFAFASDGIEELVVNRVLSVDGGGLLAGVWDRAIVRFEVPAKQSSSVAAASLARGGAFNACWDLSRSPTDPQVCVAVVDDSRTARSTPQPSSRQSGISVDGGKTWTRFAALQKSDTPAQLRFGNIAVSANSRSNLVWIPSNLAGYQSVIGYSTDAGASWSASTIGMTVSASSAWHPDFTAARKTLVAHPTVQGTFFAVLSDLASGSATVARSTDGGKTWSKRSREISLAEGASRSNDAGLRFVGDVLYLTFGAHNVAWRSSDFGSTFTKCGSLRAAGEIVGWRRAAGKPALLCAMGVTSAGQTSLFTSFDGGDAWRVLDAAPAGLYQSVRSIDVDPSIEGRVYFGFGGNGVAVGSYQL